MLSSSNGNGTNNGSRRNVAALRLDDARERTPPVDPVQAMQQSLQLALFGAVKEGDVLGMVEKLKAMALEGDLRAMKMFFGLVVGGRQAPAPQTVLVNQVAVGRQHEQPESAAFVPAAREVLPAAPICRPRVDAARHVAANGPAKIDALAAVGGVTTSEMMRLLEGHPWFERQPDGWHLTAAGRQAAVPPPMDD